MNDDIPFLIAVCVSVFAIVDPPGTVPFFVALTDGFDQKDRRIILDRAVLVLGVTLTLFALVGTYLFAAFGFTLDAFEIAGGILLFTVAYDMLHGQVGKTRITTADRDDALARRDELSVVPLGIPLLAGPGAISTVMIYEGNAGGDPLRFLAVFVAIGITTVASWVILHYGEGIFRRLGRIGIMAMSRVMGLLLAAVAVQFVLNGILGAVHLAGY